MPQQGIDSIVLTKREIQEVLNSRFWYVFYNTMLEMLENERESGEGLSPNGLASDQISWQNKGAIKALKAILNIPGDMLRESEGYIEDEEEGGMDV